MDARELAALQQILEMAKAEDGRLSEYQKGMMRQMMAQGMDEMEAKLRVLMIGNPPEHFQKVPPTGELYPRTVYHPKRGEIRVAQSEEDHKKAIESGWEDKPSEIHVRKLLEADQKRNKISETAGIPLAKAS